METHATERAYAKLTRTLRVVGRRPDGYHLLEAEMVTIDLADELVIGVGSGLVVRDEVAWDPPPEGAAEGGAALGFAVPDDEQNLVAKALALVGTRAHVELTKRIPAGAGLGGGSADAAAILRHFGFADASRAAHLGADVPFCLRGGRALVRGVGEQIDNLEPIDAAFVVVTPPFGVSTAEVYAEFDRLGGVGHVGGANDLQPAALVVEPRLEGWSDLVGEVAGTAPVLAGSGASYFVECDVAEVDELAVAVRARIHAARQRALVTAARTVGALVG